MSYLTYFKESTVFRRLFKNAGKLISGDVIASMINLVSMALAARVLGPGNFGVLAIVQSYVTIVDQIFNFQSWQALIKYGSDVLVNKDKASFKSLIKFGFCLDISTAAIGTIAAVIGAMFLGPLLEWDENISDLAMLYSLIIIFNINGTPTAILRLFDRFDLFAYQKVIVSVFKFICVSIGFYLEAGLPEFLIIWICSDVMGYILLIVFGIIELRKQELLNFLKSSIQSIGVKHKGIWSYVWTTNLHGTVRMASMQFDIIIVGALLGSVAVGYLKVAKQFAQILNKLSQPLYKSIYPELTRLWSENNKLAFKKLIISSGAIAGIFGLCVWLCFFLFGEFIINLTVGNEYTEAIKVLLWYMFGICISVFAFPITPSLLSMGYPKVPFYVIIISTFIYLIGMPFVIQSLGIVGVGVSYFLFYVVWCVVMAIFYKYQIKKIIYA